MKNVFKVSKTKQESSKQVANIVKKNKNISKLQQKIKKARRFKSDGYKNKKIKKINKKKVLFYLKT